MQHPEASRSNSSAGHSVDLPALSGGILWVALLYTGRESLYVHELPTSNVFLLLTGGCLLAAVWRLYAQGRVWWRTVDKVYLILAALPPAFMIAAYLLTLADVRVPPSVHNANWGVVGVFPGTMFAALPLVRHHVVPSSNWIPVVIGFAALPMDEIVKATSGRRELGLVVAMTLGVAWIVLGYATRECTIRGRAMSSLTTGCT